MAWHTSYQDTQATAVRVSFSQVCMARHATCQESQATTASLPFKQNAFHSNWQELVCTAASPGLQGMAEPLAAETS